MATRGRQPSKTSCTTYVALLRAVNVGGTGRLPMNELTAMCVAAGFNHVRTYIASGNAIFDSGDTESQVKRLLEVRLANYAGKPVAVMVRTAAEMLAVLKANPFPEAAPNRTMAIFLDHRPPAATLINISAQTTEEIRLGAREIYVLYGDGMAASKLKIPAGKTGTARNMNTVAKLAAMAAR
jgi:uncharacterized protein (DUF1697 family)